MEEEKVDWSIKEARKPMLVSQAAAIELRAIQEQKHDLVSVDENKIRCSKCHRTTTKRQANFWANHPCGEQANSSEHEQKLKQTKRKKITQLHACCSTEWHGHRIAVVGGERQCIMCGIIGRSIEDFDHWCQGTRQEDDEPSSENSEFIITGTLREAQKEQENQRHKDVEAAAVSRINCEVATALLVQGIPSSRKSQLAQPKWASKVHESHDAWHGGGMVFCRNCGFMAGGERQNLGLFSECRWIQSGTKIPDGSKHRLAKMKKGKFPEAGIKRWPDGTEAKITMRMRKLEKSKWEADKARAAGNESKEDAAEEAQRLEAAARWHKQRREARQEEIRRNVADAGSEACAKIASAMDNVVEKFVTEEKWEPQEISDVGLSSGATADIAQHLLEQKEWEEKADVWLEKTRDIELLMADFIDALREAAIR